MSLCLKGMFCYQLIHMCSSIFSSLFLHLVWIGNKLGRKKMGERKWRRKRHFLLFGLQETIGEKENGKENSSGSHWNFFSPSLREENGREGVILIYFPFVSPTASFFLSLWEKVGVSLMTTYLTQREREREREREY